MEKTISILFETLFLRLLIATRGERGAKKGDVATTKKRRGAEAESEKILLSRRVCV
jgi:hypothetical protein